MAAESQVLELRRDKLELLQSQQRLDIELSDVSFELAQLPLTKQNRLASFRKEFQASARLMTELDIRKGAAIVSPIDGRVVALPTNTGQSVNEAQLLLALIPKGGKIEAEVFASAKSIGHIVEGQEVRIFLDAFPFRKYGTLKGVVSSISGTILYPGDLSENVGISSPAYRIRVTLNSETIKVVDRVVQLQPGMTVSAIILRSKRSLWERLTSRLI
jgi:membrane fusion protein